MQYRNLRSHHQKRGDAQQYMIGKHPNWPFCS